MTIFGCRSRTASHRAYAWVKRMPQTLSLSGRNLYTWTNSLMLVLIRDRSAMSDFPRWKSFAGRNLSGTASVVLLARKGVRRVWCRTAGQLGKVVKKGGWREEEYGWFIGMCFPVSICCWRKMQPIFAKLYVTSAIHTNAAVNLRVEMTTIDNGIGRDSAPDHTQNAAVNLRVEINNNLKRGERRRKKTGKERGESEGRATPSHSHSKRKRLLKT